jgi:hypothetical protein
MAKTQSQLLVIDASVAQSAGPEDATHPTATNCREFLMAVMEICHRMVFTAAIKDEWDEHQSGFARKWRRSMFARKKIEAVDVAEDKTLRKHLGKVATSQEHKDEMLKDAHLIEAARATGMRIIALDDAARRYFQKAAPAVSQLATVCWVNPDQGHEGPLEWLEAGAPIESVRMLKTNLEE